MENTIRLLALGDIVGPEATEYVCERLWKYREARGIDIVTANGENACAGNGIDPAAADALLRSGVDVISSGNHIWQKKTVYSYLDDCKSIIRPANYPASDPGTGYTFAEAKGFVFLVMNISGTVFMDPLASPFDTADSILSAAEGKYNFSVLDFHAEATSEKVALANYLDGRVDLIFGTHTHVATADERLLPGGTAYITDIGMCGPADSVLGVRKDIIIQKFRTKMPGRFDLAEGGIEACGIEVCFNTSTCRAVGIERVRL